MLLLSAAMNHPRQGNYGVAAVDISSLSLTDATAATDAAGASPSTSGSSAAPPPITRTSPSTPGLNILHQASNVTQLNANNTSFDPSQVAAAVVGQAPTSATGTGIDADSQQQPMLMVPSFLIQPPTTATHSKTPPQPAMLVPNRLPSPIPTQPTAPMAHVQQQHQQRTVPHTAVPPGSLPAALFQQNTAPASSSLAAAVIAAGGGVSSVQQLQMPLQQPIMQHPQQLHQSVYPENKEYYSENSKKTPMSGRVPATRRDGRKLFVGGLPNGVSDLSFLQFFQQYGEVIDSVVLLDRRTKRSRGFGFVTFADPNVAASLLTTIPGRTGMVNILGKNCEVKASEPKTAEAAPLAHSTINLPPPHHPNNAHQHPPPTPPHGWNHTAQQNRRMVFGAGEGGGGVPAHHSLHVSQTMPIPPNFNYHGVAAGAQSSTGTGVGVPIYSHSTITRTNTSGVPINLGSSADGGALPAVYIQNNFYTLPLGADLPPSHALSSGNSPTPEALVQAQQTELIQNGGAMAAALGQAAPYTTAYSSLQPLYLGSGSGEMDTTGEREQQQQQQQQSNARGHHPPYTSSRQH